MAAAYVTFQPDLAVPGAAETIAEFGRAARDHGLDRLVLLSGRGEPEAQRCEEILLGSGIDTTVVRCSFFAQNFSEHFLHGAVLEGVIALPAGEVREPIVDADDIADVVVHVLAEPGHEQRVYELTGPRLLSFGDVADDSERGHRPRDHLSGRHPRRVRRRRGRLRAPRGDAEMLAALFSHIFDGRNESLADGVGQVLGRPATRLRRVRSSRSRERRLDAARRSWSAMSGTDVVLVLATTTVGITAGVMFCYWIGVMPGLHGLTDREFIQAFQLIDRKVVNPLFVLVSFLGGGALLLAATGLEGPGSGRFGVLVAATAVYVVGVVVITLAVARAEKRGVGSLPGRDRDRAGGRRRPPRLRRSVEPSPRRAHDRRDRQPRPARNGLRRLKTVSLRGDVRGCRP